MLRTECKDKDVLAFPVILDFKDGQPYQTMLIVNRVLKTFEHYELHGVFASQACTTYVEKIEAIFKAPIFKGMFVNYTTVNLNANCPDIRLYLYDNEKGKRVLDSTDTNKKGSIPGLCVMWVVWMTHLRLTMPEVPAEKLFDAVINFTTTLYEVEHGSDSRELTDCERYAFFGGADFPNHEEFNCDSIVEEHKMNLQIRKHFITHFVMGLAAMLCLEKTGRCIKFVDVDGKRRYRLCK